MEGTTLQVDCPDSDLAAEYGVRMSVDDIGVPVRAKGQERASSNSIFVHVRYRTLGWWPGLRRSPARY